MFVNGEKEIEWTHKTLPEVALGLLLNEDRDFVDFLGDLNFGRFGKNDDLWSECLFLTIIEDDLMDIHNMFNQRTIQSKNILNKCHELFRTMNRSTIHKSLRLLGLEGQLFQDVGLMNLQHLVKIGGKESLAPLPMWNLESWSFRPYARY